MRLMRALPITAPSAYFPTSRTCSALEMPKPTATGRSVCDLTWLTNVSTRWETAVRAPVTPRREMQ